MTELDRRRISAVLAADAAVKLGTYAFAKFNRHLHQFANADLVETRKRIRFINLIRIVRRKELASIVTGEPERHLGQIVRTETEEISLDRKSVV